MDIKTIRDWFVVLCVLLFLPKDNRLSFDVRPGDWYGEVRIVADDRLLVIGKNSNVERVNLGLRDVSRLVATQEDNTFGVMLGEGAYGLPNSIFVAEASLASNMSRGVAFSDDKYYFRPGHLSILTQADLYTIYLLIAFLLALFLVLGFVIARYGVDDDFELTGK